jgi:hypothetical protein
MLLISPVLSGFQGDCKETAKRTAQGIKTQIQYGARDAKLFPPGFNYLMGPNRVSVFQQK